MGWAICKVVKGLGNMSYFLAFQRAVHRLCEWPGVAQMRVNQGDC
jgi:hypothetical protein